MTDLDLRMTFDSFVVGPASRVAAAAARRVAGAPGESYNPLFIHSASGLGKTHLLRAIAYERQRVRSDRGVLYQVADRFVEELTDAGHRGWQAALRNRDQNPDILLLDDVQLLADKPRAQEMLLQILDTLTGAGRQVVLAGDRAPNDVAGLDVRLLERISQGFVVDILPPEYETRISIIRRKLHDREQALEPGVAEALASYPFRSLLKLEGALNRVLAIQDLGDQPVGPAELAEVLGEPHGEQEGNLPRSEPPEHAGVPDEGNKVRRYREKAVAAPGGSAGGEAFWRRSLRRAAAAAESEGFVALRLRAFLERVEPPPAWEEMLRDFEDNLARLRAINDELEQLGNPGPEAPPNALHDPERLHEAESYLAQWRERQRPFGALGPGPSLRDLEPRVPRHALEAAEQLVRQEVPRHNPVLFWGDPAAGKAVLGGAGRSYRLAFPQGAVVVASATEFSGDFLRALSCGVEAAWRERWRKIDLLLMHGLEAFSGTERVQDELFQLLNALERRGSRILLAADRSPSLLDGFEQRLRSRFEGCMAVQVVSDRLSAVDDLGPLPSRPSDAHGPDAPRSWQESARSAVAPPPFVGGEADAAYQQSGPEALDVHLGSGGAARILLVDEDAQGRKSRCETLQRGGFEVIEVCDGLEALDVLRSDPHFSLIIAAPSMPHVDGSMLLREIRRSAYASPLPILMLVDSTGSSSVPALEVELLDAGADDCLPRGVEGHRLVARSRALLRRSRQ